MGKQKSGNAQTVKVSKRIRANINVYKNVAYCHISDMIKNKSLSMNQENLIKLGKCLPKILKYMQKMEETKNSSSSSSGSETD